MGVMYLFSRKDQDFPDIDTPEVSAAIRGTEMVIETRSGSTSISVLEGAAELRNDQGALRLAKGEYGVAEKGKSLRKALIVNASDAVEWALHYPALLAISDFKPSFEAGGLHALFGLKHLQDANYGLAEKSFREGKSWHYRFGKALSAYMQGDFAAAYDTLARERKPSAAMLLLQAVIAVAGGEAKEAQELLNRSEGLLGDEASLKAVHSAQKAVIALVQNKSADAQKYAAQAIEDDPSSVTACLVAAYVKQAGGDLGAAKDFLLQASKQDPENAAVLARLAELELAQGNVHGGSSLADEAVSKSPADPYVLTVAGFSHLTTYNTEKAKEYFTKALEQTGVSGEAYLGYGLSLIREGELELGREEIEKAVHADPQRGIYRSYLGKAYFEEERESDAQNEYELAIERDPNDPTPYLYRAFNNLSQNKVVAALDDIEDSIRLNDNRAVYRSRFLLDQDQAVRSTSLGEVFQQLGFEKVAELEAMKSIHRDYTNYAAHRLLADSLEGSFFADARFTENVVADLFAPVSFNVFQEFSGFSSEASLNDYAALFDRPEDRIGVEASATTANDLLQGNVFQTGARGPFGYYLGYNTDYGRGRKRGGTFDRRHRFDLASQYQIDYDNRVIGQTAFTRRDHDRLGSDFTLEDFEVALGSHHRFGRSLEWVNRLEYFNRDNTNENDNEIRDALESVIFDGIETLLSDAFVELDEQTFERNEFWRLNSQVVHDSEHVSIVAGGQFVQDRGDFDEDSLILSDEANFFTGLGDRYTSQVEYKSESYTGYLYSTFHTSDFADFTLGVNYSEIELPGFDSLPPFVGGTRNERRWSPKLGLSLYPFDNMILRTAYFRTLGIASLSDIGTIEPTLVGSFLQNYGDLPGARAENYGVGVDWKLPKRLYTGAEYIYRDVERDTIDQSHVFSVDFDNLTEDSTLLAEEYLDSGNEHIFKSYLYGILCKDLAATIDYSRVILEQSIADDRNETDTLGLSLRYFAPWRVFLFTKATWRRQELSATDINDSTEAFWLVDAGLGYRLPKRHGSVELVFGNIFDESFRYQDIDGRGAVLFQDFSATLRTSINF